MKTRIILFGTGKMAEGLIKKVGVENYNIIAFCDNDINKQKTGIDIEIDGKPQHKMVISPSEIDNYEYDYICIATAKYYKEIEDQLIKLGCAREKIRFFDEAKHMGELSYWIYRHDIEGVLDNSHYKKLMLSIAQEEDDTFWENKVVADFGCGPRGSLAWSRSPRIKLGIDVLVGQYLSKFGGEMTQHDMLYIGCSEEYIPIPDASIDYLCTINSLDHVSKLGSIINELLRIMKPNAELIASFNLNEAPTAEEPQMLTEELLQRNLLCHFKPQIYRLAYKGTKATYENFENGKEVADIEDGRPAILWYRGRRIN